MQFITFSGVDGSGKSTQLSLLKKKLEGEGKKVAYFHAVEFSLASRFKKKLVENHDGKAVTQASWLTILLRKLFLFIDLLRFRPYIASLHKQGYDYLLSDRYFYDTLINIEYLSKKTCHIPVIEAQFIIKPDLAFYFDLAPETIMSRDRVPEQGIDYLRDKMKLFKTKIARWDMILIDGSKPQESVFQDILNKIDT
ncbi:MAG: hypothetical protein KBB77_02515 [Candidatus Moranbacteria bacterium]|nr:hypothetical protein [Candidatus Moranbacteria bacterium]